MSAPWPIMNPNNANTNGWAQKQNQFDNWSDADIDEAAFQNVDFSQWDPSWGSPLEMDFSHVGSQDLVRNISSGGSSYNSPVAASPDSFYTLSDSPTIQPHMLVGQPSPSFSNDLYFDPPTLPYEFLEPPQLEQTSLYTIPTPTSDPTCTYNQEPVSVDKSSPAAGFFCHMCNKPPFRRRADLARHISHIHDPQSLKSFPCDYPRCTRRHEPFKRRDHLRDHLRDFHREDIERRGVAADEDWYADRNTVASWWRCNRCLNRVHVERNGWECPRCKGMCCSRRQSVRMRKVATDFGISQSV